MTSQLEEADLEQLEAMIQQYENRGAVDADTVRVLIQIADVLNARDLGDYQRQTALLYNAADLALTGSQLSLEDELHLLSYLETDSNAGGSDSSKTGPEKQRERARRWLTVLNRLDETIGPDFDPNELPVLGVVPPAGLPVGVAPDAIDDPGLRQRYEAELEDNKQKAKRYAERFRARQLRQLYEPGAVRYVAKAFGPSQPARAELARLLDEYGVNLHRRTAILGAARARNRGTPS
jgi:hypothetical protein